MISIRSILLFLLLFFAGTLAAAADETPDVDEPDQPLFLKMPFNRLTLTSHYNGVSFNVQPIEFPGGIRPNPLPRVGDLVVKFVNDPFKEFQVGWNYVEKIELFSEMVQQEYRQRLDELSSEVRSFSPDTGDRTGIAGRFELMFDYLLFLKDYRQELPDFAESHQRFLYEEAVFRIKAEDFSTGLARFETLFGENRNYPGLEKAWGSALDLTLDTENQAGNAVKCRQFLGRFKEFYPDHEVVRTWEKRLLDLTKQLVERSKRAFDDKDFLAAHRLCEEAAKITPDMPELANWRQTLQSKAPRVDVAVDIPLIPETKIFDPGLPDRAAQRGRRLLCRMLCDYIRPGLDGGIYASSVAEIEKTDKNHEMLWKFHDPEAHEVAGTLFRNAGHSAVSRYFVSKIEIESETRLRVRFRQAPLIPEALFAVPLPADPPGKGGPFSWKLQEEKLNGFVVDGSHESGPAVIFEHTVYRSEEAIELLEAGKVDMIDRLPPWDLDRMEQDSRFIVRRYAVPSVHFLVPNRNKPLTAGRTFRRALLYGLNRAGMLEKLLEKGGHGLVSSVPFIKGSSQSDPLGYACDSSIRPRPYEPKLAMALSMSAFNQVRTKEPGWDAVAAMPELVLARPGNEMAEFVALMIRRQWAAVGISVRIVEYRPSEQIGRGDDVDFWLVERTVKEPLVEAMDLFGSGGLAGTTSPYMELALSKLIAAEDWPTAARCLQEIHRLCYDETTVLPLWQLSEHCVYRAKVEGVADQAGLIDLYQHREYWKIK